MKIKIFDIVPNDHGTTHAVQVTEANFTLHREFKSFEDAVSACPRLCFEVQLNLTERERTRDA